jgi:hypothetical protein
VSRFLESNTTQLVIVLAAGALMAAGLVCEERARVRRRREAAQHLRTLREALHADVQRRPSQFPMYLGPGPADPEFDPCGAPPARRAS